MGFIDAADEISLILAAEAWEDYQTYRETIIRDGDTMMDPQGKVYLHPLMNSKSKGWQFVFTSLSSLGLTASARAKFGGEVKEDDPWPTFKNTRGN
jgi:P27 family predicted phage terminase small subunit